MIRTLLKRIRGDRPHVAAARAHAGRDLRPRRLVFERAEDRTMLSATFDLAVPQPAADVGADVVADRGEGGFIELGPVFNAALSGEGDVAGRLQFGAGSVRHSVRDAEAADWDAMTWTESGGKHYYLALDGLANAAVVTFDGVDEFTVAVTQDIFTSIVEPLEPIVESVAPIMESAAPIVRSLEPIAYQVAAIFEPTAPIFTEVAESVEQTFRGSLLATDSVTHGDYSANSHTVVLDGDDSAPSPVDSDGDRTGGPQPLRIALDDPAGKEDEGGMIDVTPVIDERVLVGRDVPAGDLEWVSRIAGTDDGATRIDSLLGRIAMDGSCGRSQAFELGGIDDADLLGRLDVPLGPSVRPVLSTEISTPAVEPAAASSPEAIDLPLGDAPVGNGPDHSRPRIPDHKLSEMFFDSGLKVAATAASASPLAGPAHTPDDYRSEFDRAALLQGSRRPGLVSLLGAAVAGRCLAKRLQRARDEEQQTHQLPPR